MEETKTEEPKVEVASEPSPQQPETKNFDDLIKQLQSSFDSKLELVKSQILTQLKANTQPEARPVEKSIDEMSDDELPVW